ncbi:hypothetical protein RIF29_41143 [Crotalaria pallida]|uniref:Uncharacterized protein n=1 Tax=Crotalaria pallida TaxID=3830 RepID=A0AAN9E5V6_CROPI
MAVNVHALRKLQEATEAEEAAGKSSNNYGANYGTTGSFNNYEMATRPTKIRLSTVLQIQENVAFVPISTTTMVTILYITVVLSMAIATVVTSVVTLMPQHGTIAVNEIYMLRNGIYTISSPHVIHVALLIINETGALARSNVEVITMIAIK